MPPVLRLSWPAARIIKPATGGQLLDAFRAFGVDGQVPFVVSFPDKAAAKFFLPKNITEDDWILIDAIGRAYVKRTAKAG
jgi:hypothetical protein